MTPTPKNPDAERLALLAKLRHMAGLATWHAHQDTLRQAIAAIEQQAPEWRAKESAPKNKSLLVYDARSKEYAVGWVYEFTRGTHWMPLPAPPSAAIAAMRGEKL